jgi:SOS response regulatory protein OraA/RecX
MSFKPRGKFLLKRELKQKGLDEESISSALASTEIDEVKMAISVLEKNSKKLASLSGHERKSKAFRLLASRGFNPDAIYKAFNSCYTDIER